MRGLPISGYASRFGLRDRGGDIVQKGAFAASLARRRVDGGGIRMLWQHDPAQPVGVWDEVREDEIGLFVRGRVLPGLGQGAAELVAAGALDGLSIGYHVKDALPLRAGGRLLRVLDLWEVSLVTFPMLTTARLAQKGAGLAQDIRAMRGKLNAFSQKDGTCLTMK